MRNKSLFRKRIVMIICVLFSLQDGVQVACSQSTKAELPKFSSVVYQYPFQFFYNGFKLGFDVNVKDRMVVQCYTQHVFTLYPRFYSLIGEENALNVEFIPDKLSDAKLGVMLKSRFGKNAGLFHGFYALTFAETGRGWESYTTRLSRSLPESKFFNAYTYQKFGVGVGRHYTLFNRSVLDLNMGLGFYNYSGDEPKNYQLPAIFEQGADQAYLFASMGIGIGQSKELEQKDEWKFKYGLTLDFKAILKNSMELGLLCNSGQKSLWHFFALYGSREIGEQNITNAQTFQNFAVGSQYRLYPYAGMRKEGVYFAGGYSTGYTTAIIERFNVNTGEGRTFEVNYFPQHLIFSMGVTTFVANRFVMDLYASNTYTIAKGNSERIYPHPDEATGIQTVLGLKLGIIQLVKNEN